MYSEDNKKEKMTERKRNQRLGVDKMSKCCFDFERFSVGIQTMKVWPSDP